MSAGVSTIGRYVIDTGLALHRPQTDSLRGRRYASSVHGYRGRVLTRAQALAAEIPLCDRCFPQGFERTPEDAA